MTRLMSRLGLVTAAAVALYVGTLGLPTGSSCLGTAGAEPSPTCGGDLRECLRLSADMRQTTFGGRYVTAEDVATCMEAFNACIHGGASPGGTGAPPTSPPGGSRKGLPQHFTIRDNYGIVGDCRRDGDSLSCQLTWPTPPDWVQSWTGTATGALSGLTMTGTQKTHVFGQTGSGCTLDENYSSSMTYDFRLDGTVTMTSGPVERHSTFSCADPTSGTSDGGQTEGTWTPVN